MTDYQVRVIIEATIIRSLIDGGNAIKSPSVYPFAGDIDNELSNVPRSELSHASLNMYIAVSDCLSAQAVGRRTAAIDCQRIDG